jgi:hypothetical protein
LDAAAGSAGADDEGGSKGGKQGKTSAVRRGKGPSPAPPGRGSSDAVVTRRDADMETLFSAVDNMRTVITQLVSERPQPVVTPAAGFHNIVSGGDAAARAAISQFGSFGQSTPMDRAAVLRREAEALGLGRVQTTAPRSAAAAAATADGDSGSGGLEGVLSRLADLLQGRRGGHGASGGTDEEDLWNVMGPELGQQGRGQVARGIVARNKLEATLRSHPGRASLTIKRRAREALKTVALETSISDAPMTSYVQHIMPLRKSRRRLLARWTCMLRGKWGRLKMSYTPSWPASIKWPGTTGRGTSDGSTCQWWNLSSRIFRK